MKKKVAWVLGLLALLALCLLGKPFFLGEPIDGDALVYSIEAEENTLLLHVVSPDSAIALTGLQLKQSGTDLHIRARKVLVSPFHSQGELEIPVCVDGIQRIYLGGKLIWSK